LPQQKRLGAFAGAWLPAELLKRIEQIAPVTEGARSAFIRQAIEAELDRRQADQDQPTAVP
jgi:predicted transcriptional regulator